MAKPKRGRKKMGGGPTTARVKRQMVDVGGGKKMRVPTVGTGHDRK